ncbi:hypothetical protein [Actibacterium sp. D379-3]
MTCDTGSALVAPVYVIACRQIIVAIDLAQTVQEICPTARIITLNDLAELADALVAAGRVDFAVAEVDPATFAGSAVEARLVETGAHIVLMGDAAEEAGPGARWPVLHRPFDATMVQDVLRRPSLCQHGK